MLLEDTQAELIEACRRGEPEAHRALFEQYKDRVYSIALRYSGDAAAADDITQDTFLKLFGAIANFRGDSGFDSWLYRLVVNACFDQRRRGRRLLPLLDTVVGLFRSPGRDPLDGVLVGEQRGALRAAIDSLEPDQRMVVILRYSAELSFEEIAAVLECPAGTVASRLNRAHGALEKRLRKGKHV